MWGGRIRARVALPRVPRRKSDVTQFGECDEFAGSFVEDRGVEALAAAGVNCEPGADPVTVDAERFVLLAGCGVHDLVGTRAPVEILLGALVVPCHEAVA